MAVKHSPDDCTCGPDTDRRLTSCPCPCETCQARGKKAKLTHAEELAFAKANDAARERGRLRDVARAFQEATGISIRDLRRCLLEEAKHGQRGMPKLRG